MGPERVFPDTNALFPASVMDLLLRLTEIGMHEILWSEELLEEYEEKIVEGGRKSTAQARHVTDCIRAAFANCEVRKQDYEHLEEQMTGPDPDDHVISAAAATGGATIILSSDRRGFPKRDLEPHGIVRRKPDTYLTELLNKFPDEVIAVVEEQAADKKNPPQTVDDIVVALNRAGCTEFAKEFRARTAR